MELAHPVRQEVVDREISIILGLSSFAILMLIAVVLATGGPGTSFQDYASLIATSP